MRLDVLVTELNSPVLKKFRHFKEAICGLLSKANLTLRLQKAQNIYSSHVLLVQLSGLQVNRFLLH